MFNKLNLILILFLFTSSAYAGYIKSGIIETLREDGYATVIFHEIPDRDQYFIMSNDVVIGTVKSFQQIPDVSGMRRYICRYSLTNIEYKENLRIGLDIVYREADKEIDKRLQKNPYIETILYKSEIITPFDGRSMVLIPEGKFFMGCSDCDSDEFPERIEFTGYYYIDKLEVSNNDFRKYADIKGVKYPDYWKDQIDKNGNFISLYFASLPVIVTYYEAADYALWAGKRLPTEIEWEKAGRVAVSMGKPGKKEAVYSWGYGFRDGIANTEELWESEKTGENLKIMILDKYQTTAAVKGYIPVDIYEKESLSYYGAAHLDGNAMEWTDSWYLPYKGNRVRNKKFGNQYKVIRGGAYFLSRNDARITDRKTGGMPDLYKDRIAGFRCVKNIAESDKK
jgi:formylglycine-generating enzyme required for sulfatase activity